MGVHATGVSGVMTAPRGATVSTMLPAHKTKACVSVLRDGLASTVNTSAKRLTALAAWNSVLAEVMVSTNCRVGLMTRLDELGTAFL